MSSSRDKQVFEEVILFSHRISVMKKTVRLFLVTMLCILHVTAQSPAASYQKADVESVDAIIASLYEVISGEAGKQRNWDRLRSLFAPNAKMIPIVPKKEGGFALRELTVEDYVTKAGPNLEKDGFFEKEIARKTERYGNLAHVFSTYEGRRKADDKPFVRGINSLQLMHDGTRWWVVSIMWEAERPDNPLPKEYLPKS
jgi:hypothetical protein